MASIVGPANTCSGRLTSGRNTSACHDSLVANTGRFGSVLSDTYSFAPGFAVPVANGGTGNTSLSGDNLLIANAGGTQVTDFVEVTGGAQPTVAGQALVSTGAGGPLTWQTVPSATLYVQTAVASTPFTPTAVSNVEFLFVQPTTIGTPSTVTLPLIASPEFADGKIYHIVDAEGGAFANPITINATGPDTTSPTNLVLNQNNNSLSLVANSATGTWYVF